MRHFNCEACDQPLYFESLECHGCGSRLGYLPDALSLVPLGNTKGSWAPLNEPFKIVRFCQNAELASCNWLIHDSCADAFCIACQHNRMVPDLSVAGNVKRWGRIEQAKRRLFYTLLRLNLPISSRQVDDKGLVWDFLADSADGSISDPILTGHFDGVITINIAEADDAERERRRVAMREPYRTLLGHFRHEVGHYYWIVLVDRSLDSSLKDRFRTTFGDERQDYQTSLERHYLNGPPDNWQETWISSYASAHPWEDWAETWAHYLHMVDTLETASAFGLRLKGRPLGASSETVIDFDPHSASFERLISGWIPLTFAANSLNRSMGQRDLYPFVLTPVVVAKLGLVHELIRSAAGSTISDSDDGLRAIVASLRLRIPVPDF